MKSVDKVPGMISKLQKFGKVDSVKVKVKVKPDKESVKVKAKSGK